MFETFAGFSDYVKSYGLERSEGVLLRYLSQLYKTLDQTVPEPAKTDELWDVLGFFRSLVGETDASLLEEWESLRHPELLLTEAGSRKQEGSRLAQGAPLEPARLRGARAGRDAPPRPGPRAEGLGGGGRARLAEAGDGRGREGCRDPLGRGALRGAMAPFFEEHGELVSGAESRLHQWTNLRPAGPRRWEVTQTLLDPEGDHTWAIFAEIDLRDEAAADGPILRIERIGT